MKLGELKRTTGVEIFTSEMCFLLALDYVHQIWKLRNLLLDQNRRKIAHCTTLAFLHGKDICKGVRHTFLLNERNFIGRNHWKGTQKVDFQWGDTLLRDTTLPLPKKYNKISAVPMSKIRDINFKNKYLWDCPSNFSHLYFLAESSSELIYCLCNIEGVV